MGNANKQLASTARIFGVSQYAGVLVILNDKVKVLSPEIIASRVIDRLRQKRPDGDLRFSNINFVFIVSETHLFKGKVPTILLVEGPEAKECGEAVSEYLNYIVHSWAAFNGGDLFSFSDPSVVFKGLEETEESTPFKVTRSEERAIWYRENRYMASWSDEKVLEAGARLIDTLKPFYMKHGPKMDSRELAERTLAFTDIIEESNFRGLDLWRMKEFSNGE